MFRDSLLVISYREDGVPTIDELTNMLCEFDKAVDIKRLDYKYVLSNGKSKEVLLITK